MLSFSLDTNPQLFCYLFIALSIIHCLKSAQKSATQVCQVATVVITLSNPVPWQNWMAAYLGYTLRMRTPFRGWPVMVNDTHTRRRRLLLWKWHSWFSVSFKTFNTPMVSWEMNDVSLYQKQCSKCCQVLKLCHINHIGPVFLETPCTLPLCTNYTL